MSVCTFALGSFRLKLWPARSPELKPLNFNLCGQLKITVHATAVNCVAEIQEGVEDGC